MFWEILNWDNQMTPQTEQFISKFQLIIDFMEYSRVLYIPFCISFISYFLSAWYTWGILITKPYAGVIPKYVWHIALAYILPSFIHKICYYYAIYWQYVSGVTDINFDALCSWPTFLGFLNWPMVLQLQLWEPGHMTSSVTMLYTGYMYQVWQI